MKEIRDTTERELNQLKSRIDTLLNEKDRLKRDGSEQKKIIDDIAAQLKLRNNLIDQFERK